MIYIVSLPTVDNQNCKTLDIIAVKNNGRINKINFNTILNCEKGIYGIKNYCKKYNSLQICLSNNVVDLSNDTCINNLLKSRLPNCMEVDNQHIPTIEEMGPGIILLNKYNGEISISNESTFLNGNFIILYTNVTIAINGKKFYNEERTAGKPLPAILQPSSAPLNIEEFLSLEMLKQLHFNNTKEVSLLEAPNRVKYGTSITLIVFLIVIALIFGKNLLIKQKEEEPNKLSQPAIEGLNQIFNTPKDSNEDV
uniref:Retrovirus-related Env polyprotein from transposon gypsy n=1 Tax=Bactrocera latifrons TaxID=174628 RepID=A0A0K8V790_BACLA